MKAKKNEGLISFVCRKLCFHSCCYISFRRRKLTTTTKKRPSVLDLLLLIDDQEFYLHIFVFWNFSDTVSWEKRSRVTEFCGLNSTFLRTTCTAFAFGFLEVVGLLPLKSFRACCFSISQSKPGKCGQDHGDGRADDFSCDKRHVSLMHHGKDGQPPLGRRFKPTWKKKPTFEPQLLIKSASPHHRTSDPFSLDLTSQIAREGCPARCLPRKLGTERS